MGRDAPVGYLSSPSHGAGRRSAKSRHSRAADE